MRSFYGGSMKDIQQAFDEAVRKPGVIVRFGGQIGKKMGESRNLDLSLSFLPFSEFSQSD